MRDKDKFCFIEIGKVVVQVEALSFSKAPGLYFSLDNISTEEATLVVYRIHMTVCSDVNAK